MSISQSLNPTQVRPLPKTTHVIIATDSFGTHQQSSDSIKLNGNYHWKTIIVTHKWITLWISNNYPGVLNFTLASVYLRYGHPYVDNLRFNMLIYRSAASSNWLVSRIASCHQQLLVQPPCLKAWQVMAVQKVSASNHSLPRCFVNVRVTHFVKYRLLKRPLLLAT